MLQNEICNYAREVLNASNLSRVSIRKMNMFNFSGHQNTTICKLVLLFLSLELK